jgi:D-methionine transport system substrate-binding protein
MKRLLSLFLAAALAVGVTACSSSNSPSSSAAKSSSSAASSASGDFSTPVTLKVGVNGTDFRLWDDLNKRLKQYNITLEPVSFADYIKPNQALADKEIDLNAFQTEIYFNTFIKQHNLNLVSLGYTFIAPMGVYSQKIKDISKTPNNAKVAIPNDATNGGRALILLQSAGLIKLDGKDNVTPTTKNISDNPKNLQFVSMESVQIPRSLGDVDIAAINTGAATDAGLSPVKDAIYRESSKGESAKNYFNILAVRPEDKDKPAFKKLLEVYYNDETKKVIDEIYKGAAVPVW